MKWENFCEQYLGRESEAAALIYVLWKGLLISLTALALFPTAAKTFRAFVLQHHAA